MSRWLRALVPAALRPLAWRADVRAALVANPPPKPRVTIIRVSRRTA